MLVYFPKKFPELEFGIWEARFNILADLQVFQICHKHALGLRHVALLLRASVFLQLSEGGARIELKNCSVEYLLGTKHCVLNIASDTAVGRADKIFACFGVYMSEEAAQSTPDNIR